MEKCCHSVYYSVSIHLWRSLSKAPSKHGFLHIYLTIFFGISISGNTSSRGSSHFGKCLKFSIYFKNWKKKIEKKFFVFEIVGSEFVPLNCLCEEDNAFHWLSMCQPTVLGFCVSLKETFSHATPFTVINKYWKSAVLQIATVFWSISRVVCLGVLWNTAFQTFISTYFSV